MEVVPTSILALTAIIAMFIYPTHKVIWVFLALTPFGAAAAFNLPAVGGASIGVMDIGALTLFAVVGLSHDGFARLAGSVRIGQPGFYLLLLAVMAIVSAIIFPRLFMDQTEVFGLILTFIGARLGLLAVAWSQVAVSLIVVAVTLWLQRKHGEIRWKAVAVVSLKLTGPIVLGTLALILTRQIALTTALPPLLGVALASFVSMGFYFALLALTEPEWRRLLSTQFKTRGEPEGAN